MKTEWFKRWGWFYLPVTGPGFVIVAGALAFCAQVFRAVDRKSHSVTDTLYTVLSLFRLHIFPVGLGREEEQR